MKPWSRLTRYLDRSNQWTEVKSMIGGNRWRHSSGTDIVVITLSDRLEILKVVAEAEELRVPELRVKMMEEMNE